MLPPVYYPAHKEGTLHRHAQQMQYPHHHHPIHLAQPPPRYCCRRKHTVMHQI